MSPLLLSLLTFLAVIFAIVGGYSILTDLVLRDRSRVSQRVSDEFRQILRDRVRKSEIFKDLGQLAADALSADQGPLGLGRRLQVMVEQSGLNLSAGRLLAISAGVATLAACSAALASLIVLGESTFVIVAAAGLIGSGLPLLYVRIKQKLRQGKLLSQLPDAFDLMARVIRAGQTMSQAMQAIADEFERPLSAEFAYCYEQQNLGLAPEIALRDLSRRAGLLEVKIFVLAILVQQQTGGNLAELLERLATVIRERFRIREKINALTAEGRFQAIILLALPLVVLLAILFFNFEYGRLLLERRMLVCKADCLILMFFFEILGALWIRRIVKFDI